MRRSTCNVRAFVSGWVRWQGRCARLVGRSVGRTRAGEMGTWLRGCARGIGARWMRCERGHRSRVDE